MTSRPSNSPRKEQIINIAKNLFRERGYSATSMRDLASAVGIEAASLYNHIKSKNEILEWIVFGMAEEFFAAIRPLENRQDTPEMLLPVYIEAHIGVIVTHMDAAAVFLHEWRHLEPKSLQRFIQQRKSYESKFVEVVQRGIDCRQFQEVEPDFHVMLLFSSMNWIYDWYKEDGPLSPEEIAKQIADLFLHGLSNNRIGQ